MAGLRSRLQTALPLLAAAAMLSGRPAAGADIHVGAGENGVPLVFVSGPMVPGDVAAFLAASERLPGAVVVLDSPGGSLVAGIQIGRVIRARAFATLVPEGARCASACALAWLGGAPRYMVQGSAVGFHAAYTVEAGQAATSGVGNALVGAYLAQLGLRDRAVVYITQARHDQMTWLDADGAMRTGIDLTVLAAAAPRPAAAAMRRPGTAPPPRAEAPPQQPAAPAPSRVFPPVTGPVHREVFRIGGRSLPLPPGDWIEVSRRERQGGDGPGTGDAQEMEAGLVRASEAGIDAFIAVRTTEHARGSATSRLWGSSGVCARTDTLERIVVVHTDSANECAALNYAVADASGRSASETWNAFAALYEGRAGAMPETLISVSYRFAGPRGATSVAYYFGVEAYGFPRTATGWAESPWHRRNLNDERRAHLHRIRAWMRASFDPVKAGAAGGAPAAAAALANP